MFVEVISSWGNVFETVLWVMCGWISHSKDLCGCTLTEAGGSTSMEWLKGWRRRMGLSEAGLSCFRQEWLDGLVTSGVALPLTSTIWGILPASAVAWVWHLHVGEWRGRKGTFLSPPSLTKALSVYAGQLWDSWRSACASPWPSSSVLEIWQGPDEGVLVLTLCSSALSLSSLISPLSFPLSSFYLCCRPCHSTHGHLCGPLVTLRVKTGLANPPA